MPLTFWKGLHWKNCKDSSLKNLPANAEDIRDVGLISGQEDPLEENMTTHSSILAWRIPWTEEPGGLLSIGSQRVRHNWSVHMRIESKFIFERLLFNFESFCVCMTMDTNPCRMTHYLALISPDSFLAPPSHLLIDYLKTWERTVLFLSRSPCDSEAMHVPLASPPRRTV